MSEKKISYLSRNFDDYKKSLLEFTKKYYPEIADGLNDASIGSWLVDMVAAVSDNLSYHIDRVYGETSIDSAQEPSSLYALARSNGFKIPGPKGAMTEVKFSCLIPVYSEYANDGTKLTVPNWHYAPIIKKGTKVSSGSHTFEVMDDINFNEQFNNDGVSDRQVFPRLNNNGDTVSYEVTKTATVVAGESKIYKQLVNAELITPFMEIIIPEKNIMNIESIIFKDGADYKSTPTNVEFSINKEHVTVGVDGKEVDIYRFFEVNSLLEQYRWGDELETTVEGNTLYNPNNRVTYGYHENVNNKDVVIPCYSITKGQWKPLTQKFITEYTDNGYLKIIFGSGIPVGQSVDYSNATDFTQAQISRMVQNNAMGKLPPQELSGSLTMYVKYRSGGGASSNIPAGALRTISFLDMTTNGCTLTAEEKKLANSVRESITVTNTIPSVSGKNLPTIEELRNMIKYYNASQERCVTVKDYENRVSLLPAKYGSPFRVSATEENNKIMLYLIGLDNNGYLTSILPEQLITNIINYLSMYRSVNDFVEIKSARIINLSFDIDIFVDKNYNAGDVIKNVIETVTKYMDINKRYIGEDIFVGDIEKEVSKVDGVLNLIDFRVYNEHGPGYSSVVTPQETKNDDSDKSDNDREEIDLGASDYILITESDSIFELKYPYSDIKVKAKSR